MAQFSYLAYGLRISCTFALPELLPWNGEGASEPDLSLELTGAPRGGHPNPPVVAGHFERLHSHMAWPDIGEFELYAGRRIEIRPAPRASQAMLRAYLLGPVLATALYQRGFLVLHASCVALRDAAGQWGAVGFLGHSGEGKSTMAAALHARGHRVMCDDIIAVPIPDLERPLDSQFARYSGESRAPAMTVFPGFPQLRLWPQSLEALGEEAAHLPLLYADQERRVRRVAEGFEATGVPLRALFVLERGETLEARRFSTPQAMIELIPQTYCGLRDPRAASNQFRQCGALARTLPVWALQRPRDLGRLGEVAALIETNWGSVQSKTRASSLVP